MTLPSRKNPRITQQSTRRWNHCERTGWPARTACLLLAALVALAGPGSAEAGKRRRNASLERLKQRNATERWQRLQQEWQPLPSVPEGDTLEAAEGGSPAADSVGPAEAAKAAGRRLMESEASSQSPSPTAGSVPIAGAKPQPGRVLEFPTAADHPAESRRAGVPNATAAPINEVPVWIFADETANLSNEKRTAARVNSLPTPQVDPPYRQDTDSMDDARPKPITTILPYYDYSPEGEDSGEVLCPRPADCPEDDLTKPCPELVELPAIPFESRSFAGSHVFWEASNLFSNPLYFEDAALERYGHTHGRLVQPLVSLGKFGGQLIGLPYQMALHPVHEHRYALGWYRPGECAPYKYYLPPWNRKAALTAGAAYTGLFFLIP